MATAASRHSSRRRARSRSPQNVVAARRGAPRDQDVLRHLGVRRGPAGHHHLLHVVQLVQGGVDEAVRLQANRDIFSVRHPARRGRPEGHDGTRDVVGAEDDDDLGGRDNFKTGVSIASRAGRRVRSTVRQGARLDSAAGVSDE